jgi:hypothetical protein
MAAGTEAQGRRATYLLAEVAHFMILRLTRIATGEGYEINEQRELGHC